MAGPEMANVLVEHLGRIERLARSRPAPFVAIVTRSGVSFVARDEALPYNPKQVEGS
jgi:hypothetical protein